MNEDEELDIEVDNIINVSSFMNDGEEIKIRFKRQDMTDVEFVAWRCGLGRRPRRRCAARRPWCRARRRAPP